MKNDYLARNVLHDFIVISLIAGVGAYFLEFVHDDHDKHVEEDDSATQHEQDEEHRSSNAECHHL